MVWHCYNLDGSLKRKKEKKRKSHSQKVTCYMILFIGHSQSDKTIEMETD